MPSQLINRRLCAQLILAATLLSSLLDAGEAAERRTLLEEGFAWVTKEGADKLVSTAREARFNTLVVCIWHGRGTSWPSTLAPSEPRWERVRAFNPDPLRYLIERAHAEGIEVHAWFTVALRQREFFPEYYDGVGYTDEIVKSFNVLRPEFRDFIVSIMDEAVARYDLDGVNLDFIRSMGVCTSPYCVDKYQKDTGRNLKWDVTTLHTSPASWRSISDWNAVAVRDIVARTARNARARKPEIVMSVSSHIGRRQLERQGADPARWANEGLIDIVFDMNYGDSLDQDLLASKRAQLNDPKKMVVLVGNFVRSPSDKSSVTPKDGQLTRELFDISASFGRKGNGAALYAYDFISDDQVRHLARE